MIGYTGQTLFTRYILGDVRPSHKYLGVPTSTVVFRKRPNLRGTFPGE